MHVRLRQRGKIDFGAELREDPPPPGDIVVISGHDSDLKLAAGAAEVAARRGLSVTLVNYLSLLNPASLPAFEQTTLGRARLVALRMIGGEGYWREGVDALRRWAHAQEGRRLICLPGGTQWDEAFAGLSIAPADDVKMLWRYLAEGGPGNAAAAMAWMAHRLEGGDAPPPPLAMPPAGYLTTADATPGDALLVIYRALAQAGDTEPAEALSAAFAARGRTLRIVYAASLKDGACRAFMDDALAAIRPEIVLTATAFAADTHLLFGDRPVIQIAWAGMARRDWAASARGLPPSDLAMHVTMPELDGRIFAGPQAFKTHPAFESSGARTHAVLRSEPRQTAAVAERAAALIRLRRTKPGERRIAVMLANYPIRDGRIGNGVGLDVAASVPLALAALKANGVDAKDAPANGAELMRRLTSSASNDPAKATTAATRWPLAEYVQAFDALPETLRSAALDRWGPPEADPFVVEGAMALSLLRFGNVIIGVQPSRGYDVAAEEAHHDPDLVPPHRYIATYLWLRRVFDAHGLVHFGKHGNLEWLPGKAVGPGQDCWPPALIGPLPHVYPFIVNDPGEGMQAKRRAAAVIVDHLTPPLTRAELHGDLARLENLIDEHALAADGDPRRAQALAIEIADYASTLRLDADAGADALPLDERVRRVDAHLCDLKEMQIRDGLHVFGRTPDKGALIDLAVAIARVPRPGAAPQAQSLYRAIATDLGLTGFDPLTRDLAAVWTGGRPEALAAVSSAPWRTAGDAVERIELLARSLIAGDSVRPPEWAATKAVLGWITDDLVSALESSAAAEATSLLAALAGRAVPPGPSGAPTRGRPDVLPTGRNFHGVDPRAVPTPMAWRIGRAAAEALVRRHLADTGGWLKSVAFSAWGTANMRTGGDDVAQALALIGCQPVWEEASGRVTGFEILPASDLRRPRVDVTFRASGLFRDAFPTQLDLIDSAVRAVAALDEDDLQNPIAATARRERGDATRVFASKPGAYGAGLQALIDDGRWETRADFAAAYLAWGGYAYGGGRQGEAAQAKLKRRLRRTEAVVQAQDNREHDILDSDDYYQLMGGLAAAVEAASGRAPRIYLTDSSRPEDPLPRTLGEEIARVVRGRAANPKWIAGVMRHGHKGAFEMAATVDYLFAFAATTDAVKDHHFDQLFDAYLADEQVRAFMAEANPAALREMAGRFQEAIRRGLWTPRRNSVADMLAALAPPSSPLREA